MPPIMKHGRFRRIYKYVFLSLILILAYKYWPAQQIEKLSDTLTFKQKNEYIDSILNPDENPIYQRNPDPIKADFNPDTKNLDVPTVINVENLNQALNKMNMRPIKGKANEIANKKSNGNDASFDGNDNVDNNGENIDDESTIIEKISILSETVTKRDFTPINSLIGYLGNMDVNKNFEYSDLQCPELSYNPTAKERTIEYTDPISLDDDMIEIRRWLLNSYYVDILKKVDPSSGDDSMVSDMSHWYKKSGSSVWLPEEQLHMVSSTVMYAPQGKNKALASFIRLQLFDSEWNEIKGRRIRYSDLEETEIDTVLTEYTKTREERHLDRISFKFPSILSIPMDAKSSKGDSTLGPEDPRILYKDGEYQSEPVIIFNMISNGKRNMFSVFPLRPPQGPHLLHPITKFKNIGTNAHTTLKSDKNWIPFFDSLKIGDSKTSRGSLYFAYTLDPLVIFKCSLDSGKCTKVQDNIEFSQYAKEGQAYLRGGTSFTPVPRQIIQTLNDGDYQKRLQMWVGFPKLLVKDNKSTCGIQNLYRPSLSLLIKEDGVFRIELLTDVFDFGLSVASECPKKGDSSIISAHGISFWDIASTGIQDTDGSIPYYNDYMGLIVGESDQKIELIVLKNVLNYVMGVYSKGKYMFGEYDIEGGVSARTTKVCECVLGDAINYGRRLGGGDVSGLQDKSID